MTIANVDEQIHHSQVLDVRPASPSEGINFFLLRCFKSSRPELEVAGAVCCARSVMVSNNASDAFRSRLADASVAWRRYRRLPPLRRLRI